jgi:glycosidase
VREFHFGSYDCLVKGVSSANRDEFLSERDVFFSHNDRTREIWEYFAHYPLYWLEKTGHPAGTPKEQSWRGIDGLRCDFAQGLPSQFWEYCINRTRAVKWDFLFMAESLDGYREVAGSKRHGVGTAPRVTSTSSMKTSCFIGATRISSISTPATPPR